MEAITEKNSADNASNAQEHKRDSNLSKDISDDISIKSLERRVLLRKDGRKKMFDKVEIESIL